MQFALTPWRDSTVYMAGVLCKLFFAERLFLGVPIYGEKVTVIVDFCDSSTDTDGSMDRTIQPN